LLASVLYESLFSTVGTRNSKRPAAAGADRLAFLDGAQAGGAEIPKRASALTGGAKT